MNLNVSEYEHILRLISTNDYKSGNISQSQTILMKMSFERSSTVVIKLMSSDTRDIRPHNTSRGVLAAESRGRMLWQKARRTLSLPAIYGKVKKQKENSKPETEVKCFQCEIGAPHHQQTNTSSECQGQILWRKVAENLALPLLYVRVREKKRMKRHLSSRHSHTHARLSRFQRSLIAKFKLAVRLTIFCSRNFKQHCLRYDRYFSIIILH